MRLMFFSNSAYINFSVASSAIKVVSVLVDGDAMISSRTLDRFWFDGFFNSSIVIKKQSDAGRSENLAIQSCSQKPRCCDVRLSPFSAK